MEKRMGRFVFLAGILIPAAAACVSGLRAANAEPGWVAAFGYAPTEVHPIDVEKPGYPYVAVRIGAHRLKLLFDTGNMVGVSLSSPLFDELELATDGVYDRLDSAGGLIARLRQANAVPVSMLDMEPQPIRVYELDDPGQPGLVGPILMGAGHFTLDCASRHMALGVAPLPEEVPGFHWIPLVRSKRHPMLILVRGSIGDRRVLIELDTGKSRTVINPDLASELGLESTTRGVVIGNLGIGDRSFEHVSARKVDQSGIDAALSEPILAGVGSDILSRFVWTVDYESNRLWIGNPR